MPILETEVVEADFKGTEMDLFLILDIGYAAEGSNQAALEAKNTKVNATQLAADRALKASTMLMPDGHTRAANDQEFNASRLVEMSNVHTIFTSAMGYAKFNWTLKSDYDTKLNQMGYAHYEKSVTTYGEALNLINDLITFIGNNTAGMTNGGMPSTFLASCTDAQTDLVDSETAYTGQVEISKSLTNAKMVNKNQLYKNYQLVHTVAEDVFALNKVTRDLFTYSVQYAIIHPPHQVLQDLNLKENSTKNIHNAVMLKDIKNAGTDVVYMYDLNKPINDANKITFNPGDVKQNTYSADLQFVHPSTLSKGLMKIWRVVHA